jgi:REP element-mobilizing transposase RayT
MGFNQLCIQGVGDVILEAARHYQLIRRWQCELLVLMPDHLHVVVSPCGEVQLHTIIRNFKSWTAKRAGVIWQSGFLNTVLEMARVLNKNGTI